MSELIEIHPEYVYITIPAEYICVYHHILAMMAEYGENILKDCKAEDNSYNKTIIKCFNMFNSAVAARKLGKNKLAQVLIKYIKAEINQIYNNLDTSTKFIFPIDDKGELKAYVSCGDLPKFEINPDTGILYKHKVTTNPDDYLDVNTNEPNNENQESPVSEDSLTVEFTPIYQKNSNNTYSPYGNIVVKFNNEVINIDDVDKDYYFDNQEVDQWNDIILTNTDIGVHNFKVVVLYNNITKIVNIDLVFTIPQ